MNTRLPAGRASLALAGMALASCLAVAAEAISATLDLYVDEKTQQVFTAPGPGRQKLGTFQQVESPAPAAAPAAPGVTPAAAAAPAAPAAPAQAAAPSPSASDKAFTTALHEAMKNKWYEKLSLRGYTQFRYHSLIDKDGAGQWFHPADRSIGAHETLLIRRGRLILSGDVSDHVYLYIQPDLNAAPGDGDFSVQLRDAYADISLDKDKEFRFRLGQSKVPYGFVNLQSSQNRAPLERPDALNSAVEGERDLGAYFMWAPASVRTRFRDLVKNGLKGSGDYGVFSFGIFSGSGLNRVDLNDTVHLVSRISYPIELPWGQIFEPGIQAYTGRFTARTGSITVNNASLTPKQPRRGVKDQRVGLSAVLYPNPFGIEAEWNFGRGPALSNDMTEIDDDNLQGGYVQASWREADTAWGTFYPFTRWQYYSGNRKFARNAPRVNTNDLEIGLEWAPWTELELTTVYAYTPERTDSSTFPYLHYDSAHRIGVQVQWNY